MSKLLTLGLTAADTAARAALHFPTLERAVVAGCHHATARRLLRLGAIAVAYTRVASGPELRVADMGRYKLRVNVSEELGTGPYFFGDTHTLWFVPSLLRAGDNCVDAGANVGHYAFHMASEVGPTGRVLAFEANPFFVSILRENVRANGFDARMEIIAAALWERSNEQKSFFISGNSANSGTSSLIEHGVYLRHENQIQVNTITLDDAASNAGIDHLRMVKIDVEKAEDHVLAGATKLLSEHRIDFLVVELTSGTNAPKRLLDLGYTGWLAYPEQHRLQPIAEVPAGHFGDFVFASPKQVETLKRHAG